MDAWTRRRQFLAASLVVALPRLACAQEFPARPVRIVVPFAPGGGNDVFARHLAAGMTDVLKQQVIVENRAGAGGTIGSDLVAKAKPDGYTLLLGHTGTLAINPSLYPRLPYDANSAFVAVGPLASAPLLLVVPSASKIASVADLVAAAKAAPGKLTFASSGSGTGGHLRGQAAGAGGGNRPGPRSLSGHGAGAERPGRRAGRPDVQRDPAGNAASGKRPLARARGHRRPSQRPPPAGAHGRRSRHPGLRKHARLRAGGAEGHAARAC